MFRRIVWTALVVALITGIVVTPLQLLSTVPLILKAETYENATMLASHPAEGDTHSGHGHDHAHDRADAHDAHTTDWQPQDGSERTVYTGLTTTLAAFGYALLLCALGSLMPAMGTWQGLMLGLAGYLVFQIAPSLGLPLLPPGVPQSDIAGRQLWWLFSSACTALALYSLYRGWQRRRAPYAVAAIAFFLLPWLIGAPAAPAGPSVVPVELLTSFRRAALLTSGIFWIVLGSTAGLLWSSKRWLRSATTHAAQ